MKVHDGMTRLLDVSLPLTLVGKHCMAIIIFMNIGETIYHIDLTSFNRCFPSLWDKYHVNTQSLRCT